MAQIDIKADASQALGEFRKVEQGLGSLETRVKRVQEATGGLFTRLQTLGVTATLTFAWQAGNQYAQMLTNVNNATNIGINTIAAWGKAVGKAGGDANKASEDLIEFTSRIGDANQGNEGLQKSFNQVGVSFRDLSVLSERDIFEKTVRGLKNVNDSAQRNRLAAQLLGKSFKDMDVRGIADEFDKLNKTMVVNEGAVKAASDAQKSLQSNYGNFKNAVLNAAQPLNELIAQIKVTTEAFERMINIVQLLFGVWLGSKVPGLIAGASSALEKYGSVVRTTGIGLQDMANKMSVVGNQKFNSAYFSELRKQLRAAEADILAMEESMRQRGDGSVPRSLRIEARNSNAARMAAQAAAAQNAFNAISPSGSKLAKIIETLEFAFLRFGATLVRFAGPIGIVLSLLWAFKTQVIAAVGAISRFFDRISSGQGALSQFEKDLYGVVSGIKNFASSIYNYFVKAILGMLTFIWEALKSIPLLGKGFEYLGDQIQKLSAWAKDYFGHPEEVKKNTDEEKKNTEARGQNIKKIRQQIAEIQKLSDAYRESQRRKLQDLETDKELLGTSEYTSAMRRAEIEYTRSYEDQLRSLVQAKENYKNTSEVISGAVIAAYDKEIKALVYGYEEGRKAILANTDALEMRRMELDQFQKRLEEVAQAEEAAAQRGQALSEAYKGLVRPVLDSAAAIQKQYEIEKEIRDIKAAQYMAIDSQSGLYDLQIDRVQKLADLETQRREALRELSRTVNLTAAAYESLESQINQAYDAQKTILEQQIADQEAYAKQQIEFQRMFATGWDRAFNEYLDTATNAARRAADQFRTFTSAMENAIDQFVETGKFSFRDLVNSLIKELAKAELKNAMADVFGAVRGAGYGKGSSGGFLGDIWNFGKSLLGFADGGRPPVGRASIVGENGPELFVPRSAGTIVPNGMMGGQSVVNNTYVTNNISALDAKSVAQLFAENRKTLLGVTEQARRELPTRG